MKVICTNSCVILLPMATVIFAQTASRLWQSPRMSFRGVKRRGNPLNRNENTVAIAIDRICFRNFYRATTLHSQNEMDKNSNRNSVRVLAWCLACFARKLILENFVRYICDNLHHFPSGRCFDFAQHDNRVGHPHPNGYSFRAFL